jgi:predicted nucleic acid-binding protein
MPDGLRFYWDTCVFLSYINGDVNRLPDIRALLESANKRAIEIVTSVFTIAEVAFASSEKQAGALDPEIEQRIAELWAPASPVGMVEFYPLIANRARNLIREGLTRGWSVKPPDAIHLATAQAVGASILHTYNLKDFAKWAPVVGYTIEEPKAAQPTLPNMGQA